MIANAVLHRSYLDRSCIQVCIFDDRIEVLSPGMLYGGLDIITAKHGKSTCRNEAIAEAFHYMKIVEAWRTGIPRIISRCKEYGLLEPVFEELGDGFKVTLFRKISNAQEKVSNTFDGYISLLKEVETTDIFINNIRMVYEHCNANTPFGQANDDTNYTIYIVSPQPQQALAGSYLLPGLSNLFIPYDTMSLFPEPQKMHIINQFLPVEFIQLLKIIDNIVQCNITKILRVHVDISDITGVGIKQIISAHFIKLGKLDYNIGRNVAV